LDGLKGSRNGVDERNWAVIWQEIFIALCQVLRVQKRPVKSTISGAEFMLLAGLTSFVDWIGSDEDLFPYGNVSDCKRLDQWFSTRWNNAENALNLLGWSYRVPLIKQTMSFNSAFPDCNPPRPLQKAMVKAISKVDGPCVLLLEAPMGEGKTEAAFYAHLELQRRFGHRGFYVALPTKATGNEMFTRTLKFLTSFAAGRTLDLQLIHGAAMLNESFQKLRLKGIFDEESDGAIRAGGWFTHKKLALLSEYGVGTVDQALLPILPVRHYFMRLWGLANRVVVLDEIHAYDAYTGTLLIHAIRWLRALGSSVILLSATLPPEFRRRLANALGTELPAEEKKYPRLTVFSEIPCEQKHFEADATRRRDVVISGIEPSIESLKATIDSRLSWNGFIGVIVNTVQRAQELYVTFDAGEKICSDDVVVGKRLSDGTEIYLFHARYPARERQKRENIARAIYGKNEGLDGKIKNRDGRRILIATQVAEQSLDLDFDMMVTDLAPIDFVLQRAGRLWRHERGLRSFERPLLFVAGLEGEKPGSFGKPLWWNKVYSREDILLRTWDRLKMKEKGEGILRLPDEIDDLVREVYDGLHYPDDAEILQRVEQAEINSEGGQFAQQTMAHQSIIGLPDDGSWKDTSRFYLYDDDEPGVHFTLKAQTRLGEDSVSVVPLFPSDNFDASTTPNITIAREWAMRTISLSRKGVVQRLRSGGIPGGWTKVPLLRNCYLMVFDSEGIWQDDNTVKLDKELGLVYKSREA
jgi:CRISPR-associated endonuclease/helicase Cas3